MDNLGTTLSSFRRGRWLRPLRHQCGQVHGPLARCSDATMVVDGFPTLVVTSFGRTLRCRSNVGQICLRSASELKVGFARAALPHTLV
jgi:hypothetical protein